MENYNELEQMRQEMASLKEKLDRQTIISEEHIRRSMCDKVRRIKTQTVVLSITALAGIALCSWILYGKIGLSLAFTVCNGLFLTAAAAFSVWSVLRLHPADMMGENLVEAGREVARMKRLGRTWKKFAYPFLVVWFVWLVLECRAVGLGSELVQGFLLGCGFGLAGGLVCGFLYDRKQTAVLDGLLKQIDELTR